MAELPGLVKAMVVMDVGPLVFFRSAWSWEQLSKTVMAGIAYQYWLFAAYALNRASGTGKLGAPGRQLADRMAKLLLLLIWKNQNKEAELAGDRITAAACYPYFFFQKAWGVKNVGPLPGPGEPDPPCPCLFLYGQKKPFYFHDPSWVQSLQSRPDCKVV